LDAWPAILIAATESTPTIIDPLFDPPENIELLAEAGIAKILACEAIKIPVFNPSLVEPYTSMKFPTFKSELSVLELIGSETAT